MIKRKQSSSMSHEKVAQEFLSALKTFKDRTSDSVNSEIKKLLIKARDLHYNLGISIMSDFTFDSLEKELKEIIPQDDYFKKIGAPVQKVTVWKKLAHKISMKSLNKVNFIEEFQKWIIDCGTEEIVLEDKLDGGSIDLEYSNGELIHAITRGDGVIGEDIAENVKRMQGIKSKIDNFSGSIRGEMFILADDFEKMNLVLKKSGEKELSNPRNGAVGTAKRFDGRCSEYLTVYVYDIESDDLYFKTEFEKMEYLKKAGLKVCFYKKVNSKQAIEIFKEYEEHLRAETKYDIDGMVAKVNDNNLLDNLGLLGENYKGQVAWKFEAVKAETYIEDVEWNSGRNRRITPIANIQETPIGGVKIRNISLHNLDIFKSLKLGKGDKILISRRNDVIPALEEVLESKGNYFQAPQKCHVCGHSTEVDGAYLICPNDLCPALALGNLERWIEALDIMNISEKIIEALYNAKRIKEPADLYKLSVNDISSLERLGERSANKILAHLKEKMELDLPTFIEGLNIHNFSSRTAESLVESGLDSLEKIQNATVNDLIKIKGIQTKTAEYIVQGLKFKENIIKSLLDVGITFKSKPKIITKGNTLSGLSFCFTGGINRTDEQGERYTREMMHNLVLENGGKIEDSVKKGLSFLVMVDCNSNSSKAQKARQLNINILSEIDFFKKLGM